MKIFFLIILLLPLFLGCKKGKLDVTYNIHFKKASSLKKIANIDNNKGGENTYSQFGSYITSLTPTVFTAKFQTIRYQEDYEYGGEMTMIELIGNNLPDSDPVRIADFSNGNSVTVSPLMWGNVDNDGWFVKDEITFKYFYFMINNFYQEFALPTQYDTVTLSQDIWGNYPLREGNVFKAPHQYFYKNVFGSGTWPDYFAFGNTDSSFIYKGVGETGSSVNNPMGCDCKYYGYVVRSKNYSPFVITAPDKGKDKVISTTISFDLNDLIQVYAGYDNIPYTKDDVFVYAPRFWERLMITANTD